MDLLTELNLGKISSWQPHSNGNKCHTLAHFPPLNLLLEHHFGQIQLEASVQGSPVVQSEVCSLPGRSRVDKGGEWIWKGK